MIQGADADLPLVILGAGGHAKVLHAIAVLTGRTLLGVCDPQLAAQGLTEWRGVPVLGCDAALQRLNGQMIGLVNGIGHLPGNTRREQIYLRQRQAGFRFPALVHPSAVIDGSVRLGDGVQVMAGAVVQPDSIIGDNTLVNTGANIDHDCILGDHVHIAPGATLCGNVVIDSGAFVGAGATILPGVRIGTRAVVGAGTCLRKPLAAHGTHTGRDQKSPNILNTVPHD